VGTREELLTTAVKFFYVPLSYFISVIFAMNFMFSTTAFEHFIYQQSRAEDTLTNPVSPQGYQW